MIQIVPTPYSLPAAEDLQRDAPFHPRTTWGDMPWAMPLTWMTPQEIIGQASETKKKIQEALDAGISVIDCTKEPDVERRNAGAAFTVAGRIENSEPWGQRLPLGSFEIWVPAITDNEVAAPTASVSASWAIRNKYPLGPFEFSYQPVNPIFSDMSTEIAAGDLVVLKSGGPIMTAGETFIPATRAEREALTNAGHYPPTTEIEIQCHYFIRTGTTVSRNDLSEEFVWESRYGRFPASALKKV